MLGRITLVGAGELMPAMSSVHRTVLGRLSEPPRPVFLDTPAGFETNVDNIIEKAIEYYDRYLQTKLRIASYRHRDRESAASVGAAVAALRDANLIFAGPGSPTYAIKQWRDSPVWQALVEAFEGGADLLFASAASIAVGCYALPVYEIYKSGEDPFWVDGLDLLGSFGLKLAVVPHFDDASGGENYDSRFCYMGARRFDALQPQLPNDVTILGIDAYTAVCFDPNTQSASVHGRGAVTLIGEGAEKRYKSGATVPFAEFGGSQRSFVAKAALTASEVAAAPADSLRAMIEALPSLSEAERIELLARLETLSRASGSANDAPLVDLVVELREALRGAKRYDLADMARDTLDALGYEVGDTREGVSWSRKGG